jgi:hypothetical protein
LQLGKDFFGLAVALRSEIGEVLECAHEEGESGDI